MRMYGKTSQIIQEHFQAMDSNLRDHFLPVDLEKQWNRNVCGKRFESVNFNIKPSGFFDRTVV